MLRERIDDIAEEAGAIAASVSLFDYGTDASWSLRGERVYHAASTIKVAVLVALFDAFDRGVYPRSAVLHVRNRFRSAVGGEPFQVDAARDANGDVFAARGQVMALRELARHMIQTSSNLATNLLVDLLGPDTIREALERLGVRGVSVLRGVEDDRAWEADINNTTTADGLVRLFRLIEEQALSEESTQAMREILIGQQFRSGIPEGLPEEVRSDAEVANKTGEISTVVHDAGIVHLPSRKPYVLAILTEWEPDAETSPRRATLASISAAVYEHLAENHA